MTSYEAPGKVNLSLLVSPPRSDGYHPLASLVQTVEWCDTLRVARGEGRDDLESEIEDNLVSRALAVVREFGSVPPLRVQLVKEIPIAAGLGGGSSDAAAALKAAADFGSVPSGLPARRRVAGRSGRVAVPHRGHTMMSGVGDEIESVLPGLRVRRGHRRAPSSGSPPPTSIGDGTSWRDRRGVPSMTTGCLPRCGGGCRCATTSSLPR